MRVARCDDCGALQAGSGELCVAEGGFPCQARTCPYCGRLAAIRLRADVRARVAAVAPTPETSRYGWRHVTLTTVYRPGDSSEVTASALRDRVVGLIKAIDAAWRSGLGQKCAGLFWRIELGDTGAVHAHCLYWGPYIAKEWLETTLREAFDRCGFVWIREVDDADHAVGEVCKYVTKSPSPLNERWLTRDKIVMHPTLVARWEVATLGLQLHGGRGVLRHKAPVTSADVEAEHAKEGEAPERPTRCECCGSPRLRDVVVDLLDYVRHQHARGVSALRGTRAPPPRRLAIAPAPPPVECPTEAPWSPLDDAAESLAAPAQDASPWREEWVA